MREQAIAELFIILSAVIGVIFLIGIIALIIQGIPLYKMGKAQGVSNPWLAFLPIGNIYVMCNIPKHKFNLFNFYVEENRMHLFSYYLIFTYGVGFAVSLLSAIPFIGFILSIAYYCATIVISYHLIKDILDTYLDEDTMLLAILSLIVPLMQIILLYICMSKEAKIVNDEVIDVKTVDELNNEEISTPNYDINKNSDDKKYDL
jgi:MFS family permease